MRLRVDLQGPVNWKIPFNYNHILASVIYQNIKNPRLAKELHNSTSFKYFTFSQLDIPQRRQIEGGFQVLDGKVSFYVSSPSGDFIMYLMEGFLDNGFIRWKGLDIEVQGVEILLPHEIRERMHVRTLSPVLARIKRPVHGKIKIWDLNPGNVQFYDALQNNLLKKYKMFYGGYDGEEYMKIIPNMGSVKRKRITIEKDHVKTFHRAYMMRFDVEADPNLLEFACDVGFGEKNSMGFGMVEVF